MDKKDENAESSPLGHDSKRYVEVLHRLGRWPLSEHSFRDTAGASSQSTETDNDSYMADEKEAAQHVKESVKSYIKVLNNHIPTVCHLPFALSAHLTWSLARRLLYSSLVRALPSLSIPGSNPMWMFDP